MPYRPRLALFPGLGQGHDTGILAATSEHGTALDVPVPGTIVPRLIQDLMVDLGPSIDYGSMPIHTLGS